MRLWSWLFWQCSHGYIGELDASQFVHDTTSWRNGLDHGRALCYWLDESKSCRYDMVNGIAITNCTVGNIGWIWYNILWQSIVLLVRRCPNNNMWTRFWTLLSKIYTPYCNLLSPFSAANNTSWYPPFLPVVFHLVSSLYDWGAMPFMLPGFNSIIYNPKYNFSQILEEINNKIS